MTLSEQLDKLSQLKGWLDAFRPFPASVVREMKGLYDVRLTYNSNAIEGNTLTQSETEMVLTHGITVGGKSLREHLEVVGHKEALDYVEELARQGTPLLGRDIQDIHSLLMRGVDRDEAGRYRRLDVRAAGTEHVYPPHYHTGELMEGFSAWLGDPAGQAMHPVAFASEAHYRFVSIHPFQDGNGRTGRLLMNLLLLRAGYPVTVVTNARRAEYIDALVFAQSHGDEVGPLTGLVADACRASLVEYLRILSTAEESRERGTTFREEMLAAGIAAD